MIRQAFFLRSSKQFFILKKQKTKIQIKPYQQDEGLWKRRFGTFARVLIKPIFAAGL
jgi:hypothetical protein